MFSDASMCVGKFKTKGKAIFLDTRSASSKVNFLHCRRHFPTLQYVGICITGAVYASLNMYSDANMCVGKYITYVLMHRQ